MANIIFPEIETNVSLTVVYCTCFSKPSDATIDYCFKFKRYYTLEGYNQRNFVLNIIWTIISNAVSFYLRSNADRWYKSLSRAKG